MNEVLQEILTLLDIEPIERNLYRGQNHNTEHVFGGQVLAQALTAAYRTVEAEHALHSLHAYFLRPGRAEADIEYHVERAKEGRNFAVRNVAARQRDELIFQLQASFQRPASGVSHQAPRPEVPPPDGLPNRDQLRGRANWQDMPLEVRMVTPITGRPSDMASRTLSGAASGSTLAETATVQVRMRARGSTTWPRNRTRPARSSSSARRRSRAS